MHKNIVTHIILMKKFYNNVVNRLYNRPTPLILLCKNQLSYLALQLIAKGQSKPERVDQDGRTALIHACINKMSDVALELIKTGQSNEGHADESGSTALIYACKNKMTDVALKLIETGKSKPEHTNNDGRTALSIAEPKGMTVVIAKLKGMSVIDFLNDLLKQRQKRLQNNKNPLKIVINLQDANLEGANLKGANLEEANLEGANLEGANLEGAKIVRVNFKRANLTDANLKRSTLCIINFTDANLTRANLSDCLCNYPDTDYIYFNNANLTDANLTNYVNRSGVNFENANLTRANLSNNEYRSLSNFQRANLTDANLSNLTCNNVCNVSGAEFINTDLTNVNMPEIIRTYIAYYRPGGFVFPTFRGTIYDNLREIDFVHRRARPIDGTVARAVEVHLEFENFEPIKNKYLKIINQPEIDLKREDIYKFITTKFSKNIGELFPKEEATDKIKDFIKVLNKISKNRDSIPKDQEQLIAKSVNFVFTQDDDNFKKEYIKIFLDESCNAYSGSGDNTSCVKGIIERIVLSVGKAAQILCIDGTCKNPTYIALDKLMNPKFDINEEAKDWFDMAPNNQEIKKLSKEERKKHFTNYLINRAKEWGSYSPETKEKINAYADEIDYSFDELQIGGKNRKRLKEKKKTKTVKHIKHRKSVKRMQERKTATRIKRMKYRNSHTIKK